MIRIAVVAALGLFMLGLATPNISQLWDPFAQLPINVNYDGVITSVDPGSDAANEGVAPGDVVDFSSTTLAQRLVLLDLHYPRQGDAFAFRVREKGVSRLVTVRAEGRPEILEDLIVVLRRSTYVLFAGIAAFILLRRPNKMTWAFYLYSLAAIYGNGEYFGFLPAPVYFTICEIQVVLLALGNAAFLTFAARFPSDRPQGWAAGADRAAPLAFLLLAVTSLGADLGTVLFGVPSQALVLASTIGKIAVFSIALFTLFHTYFGQRGQERQRLKIVVWALVVAYAANVVILWIDTFSLSFEVAFWWDALGALNLVIPIAVAYAVLRYRVMDVNFIFSRALVYGVITTGLVAMFALIDWIVGTVLAQERLAVAANVVAAVVVGLSLNGIHGRVERIIRSVLFKRRHAAARRLAQLASSLPHVTDSATISAMVVDEPMEALSLASAALFRANERGTFERVWALGWGESAAYDLDPFERLVDRLRSEGEPTRVGRKDVARDGLPAGDASPIVAVPIVVRSQLEAVAMYGAHTGGEDLDPDEIGSLRRIGEAAGAAYYHLEADSLRSALEGLALEIDTWRARALELGWSDAKEEERS
ncbi:MAG TPA: hypothetical protein VID24_04220 [Candidatus Eremiobacteraceae bacterium]|jgi:hypothetical protein